MEQVQFDTAGFAITSGFVIAYTTDNAGIFTGSEEQWISEGCGLAANAYLDAPPKTKQGFAIVRTEKGWDYVVDFRGKTFYDKTTKAEVTISELGEIPENLTALKPESELCEWNGKAWVINPEKQAALKAKQQEQIRQAINTKRDQTDAGGVFVEALGKWVDSDEKAYQNILGVKASLDLLGDMDIPWTWADNTTSIINRTLLAAIVGSLLQAKQQNHANALKHKEAMMVVDNPLDYDYSQGWSKTYADYLAEVGNE